MKRKSLYILSTIAVIPLAAALLFNVLSNRKEYRMSNERGNRKELGKVTVCADIKSYKFLTVSADNMKLENRDYLFKYNHFIGNTVKENKSFFREENGVTDANIDENNNYLVSAYTDVVHDFYKIKLKIKDKKSGNIYSNDFEIEKASEKFFSTESVKICGNYVNVLLAKSVHEENYDSYQNINYKFDLKSGKLLKVTEISNKQDFDKSHSPAYYNESFYMRNAGKDGAQYLHVYNSLDDTEKKIELHHTELDIMNVGEYNNNIYVINGDGKLIIVNAEGKAEEKTLLKMNGTSSITETSIDNGKVSMIVFNHSTKQYSVKVFSLESQKLLYSGDIMEKSLLNSKLKPLSV